MNDALSLLDTLVQLTVLSRTIPSPPASPKNGDTYFIPDNAESNWAAHTGALAVYHDDSWAYTQLKIGWRFFVQDEDVLLTKQADGLIAISNGSSVTERVEKLGIATDADETNRLAARLNTALLTCLQTAEAGTGDIRLVLNREDLSRVASVLFQTDYSPGGEVGLLSSGQLSLKAFGENDDPGVEINLDGANRQIRMDGSLICTDLNQSALAGDRNKLANGNFSIWQRGTGPFNEHNQYSADRWYQTGSPGISTGSVQTQRVITNPGSTVSAYALRTNLLGASDFQLRQKIPDVRSLAGKPAALSLAIRGDAARELRILGQQWFGANGSSPRTVFDITLPVQTAWAKLETLFSFPDLSGTTIGAGSHIVLIIRASGWPNGSWFEITDTQLEEGVSTTLFGERNPAQEITICRHFFRKYATAQNADDLENEMRVRPTVSGNGPYFYDAEI